MFPFTRTLDLLLEKHGSILTGDATYPPKTAVQTPRMISDIDDSTIVMFLDEFQNTRLPQYSFEIVGWMQDAVESPTCPHFVTGSAMSILAREIIGRGSLFGRFESEEIRPMSAYWAAELALKAVHYYQADVPELMAPVIADRCGGNPFYITAIIRTEVFMGQVLLNSQRQTLPGRLFHSQHDIMMPSMFTYIRHRVRLGSGAGKEIDVFGAAGNEAWVCQSKWLTRDKVGISALRALIEQANLVQEDIRRDTLRMWLFAYNGLTREAEQFAREHGILWSSVQEFNELLQQVGLRPLPEV